MFKLAQFAFIINNILPKQILLH